MRELIARPRRRAPVEPQTPQEPRSCRLNREEQVLQPGQPQLVCRSGESGQGPLDALVMDQAAVDRQHRVRAHPMKAEPPAARLGHGLELAAYAVAPGVVHAEHGDIRRQAKAGPLPCLSDDLPLELELMWVFRVLELTPPAGAEVWAWSRDPVRRRLEDADRRRDRDAALPAARLRLHDLARQRVVDEPNLAFVSRHGRPAVGGRRGPEDQRRHRETGSRAGLNPAASTIWVATRKPSATLSG